MASRLPGGMSVGLLKTKIQSGSLRTEVESVVRNQNPRLFYERFEDFDQATLPSPWATRTATTAGTPTVTKTANAVNGVWRAILAATSEAETAGVDFGDSLLLNSPTAGAASPNQVVNPVFLAYLSIPTALTTAQTLVLGLATAFNATLTSVSKYAWFRFTANMNVTLEGKDGTTTTTGQAPNSGTVTLTAATYYLFTVDWTNPSAVAFSLDDAVLGTVNMGALASTDKMQPVIYVQKSTGTTTPAVDIDWAAVVNYRF